MTVLVIKVLPAIFLKKLNTEKETGNLKSHLKTYCQRYCLNL